MNELQMGLLGLGATAVVVVLGYNKWQESRHRKVAERVLAANHADVLLDGEPSDDEARDSAEPGVSAFSGEPVFSSPAAADGERIEPVLHIEPAEERLPVFEADAVPRRVPEPELAPIAVAEMPTTAQAAAEAAPLAAVPARDSVAPRQAVPPNPLLSPAIDYIATFEAVEPAPAYQILNSQAEPLARVRKPVYWTGYSERNQEWETIIDDGKAEYRHIAAAVQLVDRQGPVRDSDLQIFHLSMQDLADELMAVADLPPRQPALNTAAELDQFCAGVDIQIGINVVSQGPAFAGTKLRALAEAAGMSLDAEGRFVRCDDEGQVLYLMINMDGPAFSGESMRSISTHGITFLLDVPRVAHGERIFNQMVELARRFAEALQGTVVDDNRRPLSEGALEPIRQQVAEYQAAMLVRHLPAGGPLALRLFA